MPTQRFLQKKCMKMFCGFKKESYLCNRYPENNLFTLKKLIPIEDRAISCEACRFFFMSFPFLVVAFYGKNLQITISFTTFAASD